MGLNDFIKIGNRIKNLRIEKGISQKDMAEKLNIPRSTYSNYENDNREPSGEMLNKIATALNVPISDLINNKHTTTDRLDRSFDNSWELKRFREDLNLSVEKICELINFDPNTLLQIEEGELPPSVQLMYIYKLSNNFNISNIVLNLTFEDIMDFINLCNLNIDNMEPVKLENLLLKISNYSNSIINNTEDVYFINSAKKNIFSKVLSDFIFYYFYNIKHDKKFRNLNEENILEIANSMELALKIKLEEIYNKNNN